MKRKHRALLSSCAFAVMVGCSGGSEIEEIEVGHFKQPCQTLVTGFCMVSRKTAEDPWQNQDRIAGFTPTWGVSARLRVLVRHIANPPADGSSLQYSLQTVLSTHPEPAGTEFELFFGPGMAQELIVGEPSALSLKGEQTLTCADATVCADLDVRRRARAGLRLALQHPARPGEPLLATRVTDWP